MWLLVWVFSWVSVMLSSVTLTVVQICVALESGVASGPTADRGGASMGDTCIVAEWRVVAEDTDSGTHALTTCERSGEGGVVEVCTNLTYVSE